MNQIELMIIVAILWLINTLIIDVLIIKVFNKKAPYIFITYNIVGGLFLICLIELMKTLIIVKIIIS